MVAVWGFALLIGSAVALGHDVESVTASSPSAPITKMAHPTPNTDIWSSYQSMISQHEKQLSIAAEADSIVTRAKWNWLELLRRQDSANETETSTVIPPTSTKTKTFIPTSRTSLTRTTRVPPSTTTSTSSIASTTSTSTSFPSSTSTPTTTTTPSTTPSTTSSSTTSTDSTTSRKTTDDDTSTPKPTESSESITPTSKTVVRTTTLANGEASTFTSVRVISATAENAVSQTKGAPSLQTGGADSAIDRPAGGEVVALIGAALGVAYLL